MCCPHHGDGLGYGHGRPIHMEAIVPILKICALLAYPRGLLGRILHGFGIPEMTLQSLKSIGFTRDTMVELSKKSRCLRESGTYAAVYYRCAAYQYRSYVDMNQRGNVISFCCTTFILRAQVSQFVSAAANSFPLRSIYFSIDVGHAV